MNAPELSQTKSINRFEDLILKINDEDEEIAARSIKNILSKMSI